MYLTEYEWEHYVNMEPRATLRLERLDAYVKPYVIENIKQIPNLNYTADELKTLLQYELFFSGKVDTYITGAITGKSSPTRGGWIDMKNSVSDAMREIKRVNQDAYDRYIAAQQAQE